MSIHFIAFYSILAEIFQSAIQPTLTPLDYRQYKTWILIRDITHEFLKRHFEVRCDGSSCAILAVLRLPPTR